MIDILKKNNKYIFIVLLIMFLLSFWERNNFKNVKDFSPEVFKQPVQNEIENKKIIKFTKDGYEYELTPLYTYDISALIVHKMDYRWFSLSKVDSLFPVDFGLIWGNNLKDGIYLDKSLVFTQDSRFCWVRWSGNLKFNFCEWSNNHLVINSNSLERKLKDLSPGDQVNIKGKLVNVKGKILGKPQRGEIREISFNSSVVRDDLEGGACEIIYVESINILKKGNILYHYMFFFSLYGIISLIIFNIYLFFKVSKIEDIDTSSL